MSCMTGMYLRSRHRLDVFTNNKELSPYIYYLQPSSATREIYPKTKERPWPNIPQLSPIPRWEWLPTTFTHLTVLLTEICYFPTNPHTLSLALSYSYATRKSYTRISPLHGKEDCWHFRGVYELPHSHLTRIQRRLLIVASITPPTHMLPLIAIVNAPHRRFGGSPLYTTLVTLCDTAAIHKYPCFVALTYSMFLSTLV